MTVCHLGYRDCDFHLVSTLSLLFWLLLSLVKQAAMYLAIFWRGPHGFQPTASLAITWMSLEMGPSLVKLKMTQPQPTPSQQPGRDLEREAPMKPCLHSWPTQGVRQSMLKAINLGGNLLSSKRSLIHILCPFSIFLIGKHSIHYSWKVFVCGVCHGQGAKPARSRRA